MTTSRNLAAFGSSASVFPGRNRIINGGFDVWQRGTTFTITANGHSADRWRWDLATAVPTGTISQQSFTPGNAISGYEPTYFLRTAVTANLGCTVLVQQQRIEDVRTFAGQTMTLSFWAKADASVSMAVDLSQNFGSGGSSTNTFSTTTVSVTSSWQRFTITAAVTSISGKTIGAGSFLQAQFNMPVVGGVVRNGTYDLWGVQLEAGPAATPFEFKSYAQELRDCQRYYYSSYTTGAYANSADTISGHHQAIGVDNSSAVMQNGTLPVPMRATPTFNVYHPGGGSGAGSMRNHSTGGTVISGVSISGANNKGLGYVAKSGGIVLGQFYGMEITGDAEL